MMICHTNLISYPLAVCWTLFFILKRLNRLLDPAMNEPAPNIDFGGRHVAYLVQGLQQLLTSADLVLLLCSILSSTLDR